MRAQSNETFRLLRTGIGRLGDDPRTLINTLKHFYAGNALYALMKRRNPLKSQQMRAPSERTISPCIDIATFFPKIAARSYYSVLALGLRRQFAKRRRQKGSRKTIAQEGRMIRHQLWSLPPCFLLHMDAAEHPGFHPSFPAPSVFQRDKLMRNPGVSRHGNAKTYLLGSYPFCFLKIKSDVQNRSDTAHRLTDNCCLNSQIASQAVRMPAAADAPGQFAFCPR
jgi:hypothetical protein